MPQIDAVIRKIKFYRLDVGTEEDGSPTPIDYAALITELRGLDDDGKTIVYPDAEHILKHIGRTAPYKLRLLKKRMRDLPKIVDEHNTEEDIDDGSGIGESVHVVLFPNNVIGVETNRNSLSAYWICDFLKTKLPATFQELRHFQLMWPDNVALFQRLNQITKFTIKVQRGFHAIQENVATQNNIMSAINSLQELNNSGEVELTLSSADSRKRSDIAGFGTNTKNFIRRMIRGHVDGDKIKKLNVVGVNPQTNKKEPINVLDSFLIIEKAAIKLNQTSRSVSSQSMWTAIIDAYNDKQGDIARATEISIENEYVLEE